MRKKRIEENKQRIHELGLKQLSDGLTTGISEKKKKVVVEEMSEQETDREYVCEDDILPTSEDDQEPVAPKVHYYLFSKEYII